MNAWKEMYVEFTRAHEDFVSIIEGYYRMIKTVLSETQFIVQTKRYRHIYRLMLI